MITLCVIVGIVLLFSYLWLATKLICDAMDRYILYSWCVPVCTGLSFIALLLPLCIGLDLHNYFK